MAFYLETYCIPTTGFLPEQNTKTQPEVFVYSYSLKYQKLALQREV